MAKGLTQEQSNQVAELNERYDALWSERRDIEHQIEMLSREMQEIREEQHEIYRQIEAIQGEIDLG